MQSNENIVVQKDGYKTKVYHFYSTKPPKASIIILHGMIEHHKRYINFADFLVSQDIDVYLYDHRGHGTDQDLNKAGFISKSNGNKILVNDVINVLQYVKSVNRSKKIFLMGHSMGSLIARNVIQQYHELDGVILSGTSHPSKIKTRFGLILSTSIKWLFGPKHLSPLFHKAMFGGNSYTKLCNRTAFDWLSGNTKSIDEYINDPYCGFICPISFYNDLIKIVMHASDSSLNKLTRNNLPILIISGSDDPVGGYGKEVKHLASLYQKYGFDHVIFKLYPGLRHEILQEINSVQVMSDITNWILKQI